MNAEQTIAFLNWAAEITDCVARNADLSQDRRDFLAARLRALTVSHTTATPVTPEVQDILDHSSFRKL